MKKHLRQLLIILPLLLVATGVFAAYSFTGPSSNPTSNNTDGPLDISATDQIKNGGLSVNTFYSENGSDLKQQSSFAGLVNGGTASEGSSTIQFGNSSDQTSVDLSGNASVKGTLQSDSLATPDGKTDTLCADANGNFYVCSTGPTTPSQTPIYIEPVEEDANDVAVQISEPINQNLTATLEMIPGAVSSNYLDNLKNQFTSYADAPGAIAKPPTVGGSPQAYGNNTSSGGGNSENTGSGTSPTVPQICKSMVDGQSEAPLGTVTILEDSNISNEIPLPSGCNLSEVNVIISSYSPKVTQEGRSIIANHT
jgi:hypothetical protein